MKLAWRLIAIEEAKDDTGVAAMIDVAHSDCICEAIDLADDTLELLGGEIYASLVQLMSAIHKARGTSPAQIIVPEKPSLILQ